MSSPFFERSSIDTRVGDHHDRIRNLEALVASGSDPSVCPDCVLDPFTVNPGDIFVPEAFRDCVNVAPIGTDFPFTCGPSGTDLVFASGGLCGNVLGLGLGLQVRLVTVMNTFIASLVINVITGPVGSWAPAESPPTWDTGWLDVEPGTICSGDCTEDITISAGFFSYGASCVGPGTLLSRWVELDEDGEFRGALDDLPQGEAFGDTLYFDSNTKEFVEGPRSVPSRAIATFMGG